MIQFYLQEKKRRAERHEIELERRRKKNIAKIRKLTE